MPLKKIIDLTSDNFNLEVENSSKPLLVEFCASWCDTCVDVDPIIEELAVKYSGRIKFCKVNVDDELVLSSNLKITGIPTLILYKNGRTLQQMIGFRSVNDLEEMLKKAL